MKKAEANLKKQNQYDDITLIVHGKVYGENSKWFKRSLVEDVNQPREVDFISERVFDTSLLSRGLEPLESVNS